jgi:hypothetical protein
MVMPVLAQQDLTFRGVVHRLDYMGLVQLFVGITAPHLQRQHHHYERISIPNPEEMSHSIIKIHHKVKNTS